MTFARRALRRLRREAWVIFVAALAFATRIWWNTVAHPPRNFVYSDMHGYFNRADDVVAQPLLSVHDYLAFYPWGTHAYLGLVKLLFTTKGACPREVKDAIAAPGCAPMDIAMAVAGAVGVVYTTLLARRLTQRSPENAASGRRRWVYVVVGLAAVFYYPFLAQGSYYLSETPFFACLAGATYHSLRLCDEGEAHDALLFGVFAGLGAWVRPQMLMSVVFLAVFWLFRRRQLAGATLGRLALAAIPLALMLVFSAVRTTRHARAHDARELALVSTNDALNWAFGRCHPIGIEARTKGYRSGFGPPSLGSLHFGAKEQRRRGLPVLMPLSPALPDDPSCEVNKKHKEKKEPSEPCISIEGKMWSRDVLGALASKCVQTTGWVKQAYYGLSHVVLNFGFNLTWPDSGQRLRHASLFGLAIPSGRPVMEAFQIGFGASVLPFALAACCLSFMRRRARDGLLAMHFWAATLVAILYFGETRLRTPYDFLFLILGLDLMSRALRSLGRRLAALTAR